MFELVCVTYIFPVRACDCLWCLPESTAALAVLCVCQWFWQWCGGRLFGLHVFGGSFSGGIWSSCTLFMWFLGGKCYLRKSPSVWDPNILATRQQTRKGSEMVSDIFETQFYCMVQILLLFQFFIFELQLWKKLVFWICFYVVWQFSVASDKVLYLFGNQVGEGQRKLLGVNCF